MRQKQRACVVSRDMISGGGTYRVTTLHSCALVIAPFTETMMYRNIPEGIKLHSRPRYVNIEFNIEFSPRGVAQKSNAGKTPKGLYVYPMCTFTHPGGSERYYVYFHSSRRFRERYYVYFHSSRRFRERYYVYFHSSRRFTERYTCSRFFDGHCNKQFRETLRSLLFDAVP